MVILPGHTQQNESSEEICPLQVAGVFAFYPEGFEVFSQIKYHRDVALLFRNCQMS